jgi:O-antigen ligase
LKIKKFVNNGLGYSAFLFSFSLLFSIKFANISLIIFYTFCVINYFINKPNISPKAIKLLKFSSLLFLTSIAISVVSGSELELIIKGLGRRITFALTPLAFLLLTKQNISFIKERALKGIVIGIFLSSVFLLINILHEYYLTRELFSINKDIFNFYHTNFYFTRILDIHPSYYGMFIIIGLGIVYFYKDLNNKFLNVLFVLLATIVILFLNSRIILFLFLVLNAFYVFSYFRSKSKQIIKAMIITASIFLFFGTLLYFLTKNTYAYQRVFKETLWELSNQVNSNYNFKGSGDSRMARWIAAVNVIDRRPFLGYGVFKERQVLEKEYKILHMEAATKSRYNAHNQFLGFALEGGFFSAISLLLFFIMNFYYSLINKDILFGFFLLSVMSICLVENYLIRNAGIIFTAFFSSLFLFYHVDEDV